MTIKQAAELRQARINADSTYQRERPAKPRDFHWAMLQSGWTHTKVHDNTQGKETTAYKHPKHGFIVPQKEGFTHYPPEDAKDQTPVKLEWDKLEDYLHSIAPKIIERPKA